MTYRCYEPSRGLDVCLTLSLSNDTTSQLQPKPSLSPRCSASGFPSGSASKKPDEQHRDLDRSENAKHQKERAVAVAIPVRIMPQGSFAGWVCGRPIPSVSRYSASPAPSPAIASDPNPVLRVTKVSNEQTVRSQ